jgi:uncharacterized protein
MVQKKISIVETPGKGRGIIACRPLRAGQRVMRITGDVIDDPSYSSRSCIDLGGSRSLEPVAPGVFLNHSCDPNCELVVGDDERVELWAIQDVAAGQELTIDYAWEAEADPYPCGCGFDQCRGYIVDANELSKLRALLRQRPQRSRRGKLRQG